MPTTRSGFPTAEAFMPERPTLTALREAAAGCQGCNLYKDATQTVFGIGSRGAEVMFVGEQPGDSEDRAGKPFVGPAGRVLDEALEEAGIDRTKAYVTNVVKHFRWERRGKRRIHKRPSAEQVVACRPWLEAEIREVKPKVVVLLGATAAQDILGRSFRVTQQRGEVVESDLPAKVMATVHPSAILRAPSEDDRRDAMAALVQDLRKVANEMAT